MTVRVGAARSSCLVKESTVNKANSNRKNAERSTGPRDTTSTRLNAVRHGLLAKGLTELDDVAEHESLLERLKRAYCPVGDVEMFFAERIAFHMIRLRRAGRLEAEYITAEIYPSVKESLFELPESTIIDPGVPAAVGTLGAMSLASGFQRYESAIENKLYRAINQLERLQRTRKGEFVPPPQTIDVAIHSRAEGEA